jgi:hypothetical protein
VSSRDRKTERRTATRREIIDAGWHLAREKGLAQVTLRDVRTTSTCSSASSPGWSTPNRVVSGRGRASGLLTTAVPF